MAVTLAGPYASLHLAPDRYHASTPPLYDSKMIIKIKRKKKFVMWQNKNCKCLGIDNPSCILAIINVNSVINTI